MKIRKDKHGLYIRSRGYNVDKTCAVYRPGYFNGYSHTLNTLDMGLTEGLSLKTRHVCGAPFVKITLPNGDTAYWGSYGRTEGDFPEELS